MEIVSVVVVKGLCRRINRRKRIWSQGRFLSLREILERFFLAEVNNGVEREEKVWVDEGRLNLERKCRFCVGEFYFCILKKESKMSMTQDAVSHA